MGRELPMKESETYQGIDRSQAKGLLLNKKSIWNSF